MADTAEASPVYSTPLSLILDPQQRREQFLLAAFELVASTLSTDPDLTILQAVHMVVAEMQRLPVVSTHA